MAEGTNEKKVYLTRSRKRSMDCLDSGQETVPVNIAREDSVIDLTREDSPCPTEGGLNNLECAICLQTCIHPARLPCGHIFCFLCVKGAAHGNKKCAMCRNPIPHNYFNNPELLQTPEEIADKNHEGYEWFYEGRHGWWQYDPRATKEIESAWGEGLNQCELLIAGYLYIIDFKEMCQTRKGQPSKRRRIKRDFANSEKLGVAGLRDPSVPPRRYSEGDKGVHGEDEYDCPDTPRRSSLDSTITVFDFLEDQFGDLSLNSDDDDSYQ